MLTEVWNPYPSNGEVVPAANDVLISLLNIQNILATCHKKLVDSQKFRKDPSRLRLLPIVGHLFDKSILGNIPYLYDVSFEMLIDILNRLIAFLPFILFCF